MMPSADRTPTGASGGMPSISMEGGGHEKGLKGERV